jgi:hypothetical protein
LSGSGSPFGSHLLVLSRSTAKIASGMTWRMLGREIRMSCDP